MRIILLLFLLLSTGLCSYAQKNTDRIYRVDKSHFEAIVDEITDTDIVYFLKIDEARSNPQRISRSQVWKIVYAGSETEIINQPAETVSTNQAPEKTTEAWQGSPAPKPLAKEALIRDESDYRYSSVTIGGDYWHFRSENPQLSQESNGLGLTGTFGGSLRLGKRFSKLFGLSLTVGYAGYSVDRNYLYEDDGELYYQTTEQLSLFPAHLGVKIYVAGPVYLMPEGGGLLTVYKAKVADGHPNPETGFNHKHFTYRFGGGLGYEMRFNKLLVDANLYYHASAIDAGFNPVYTFEKGYLGTFGARLGIGFAQ